MHHHTMKLLFALAASILQQIFAALLRLNLLVLLCKVCMSGGILALEIGGACDWRILGTVFHASW